MFKVTFNDLVIIAMEIHLFPCRTQKLSPSTAEVLGGCPLGDRRVAKLKVWSVGQGVKTPPFHGGNTGSNPVRTIDKLSPSGSFFCVFGQNSQK